MLQEKTRVVDVVREKTRADIAREIRIQEAEKKKAERKKAEKEKAMNALKETLVEKEKAAETLKAQLEK